MPVEIERKFLIAHEGWRHHAGKGVPIVQGYIRDDGELQVRVRLKGDQGYITLKQTKARVADEPNMRDEYEYPIPAADAKALLATVKHTLEKTRYEVIGADGKRWEIDEYGGRHKGLMVAEIELTHAKEPYQRPNWLGAEITNDKRYSNSRLAVSDGLPPISPLRSA